MGHEPSEQASEGGASLLWVGIETLSATSLALFLSLRLGSPLVWVLLPIVLLLVSARSLSDYGLDLRLRPPSIVTHLALGASLLTLYGVVHASVAHFLFHQSFAWRAPSHPVLDLAREFLAIGFPEEVFFRGYVQTRWDRALGKPWRLGEAQVGPGLLVQASIFAVCHVVGGDWLRLRVVFFGLLAGWLRERSGSVLSPAVYHAVANLWYRVLVESFH